MPIRSMTKVILEVLVLVIAWLLGVAVLVLFSGNMLVLGLGYGFWVFKASGSIRSKGGQTRFTPLVGMLLSCVPFVGLLVAWDLYVRSLSPFLERQVAVSRARRSFFRYWGLPFFALLVIAALAGALLGTLAAEPGVATSLVASLGFALGAAHWYGIPQNSHLTLFIVQPKHSMTFS